MFFRLYVKPTLQELVLVRAYNISFFIKNFLSIRTLMPSQNEAIIIIIIKIHLQS
jgi:hypothetical protein